MATTSDINQPIYESAIQQVFASALPANTTIPGGTVAMSDSQGRPVPFVDSTFQGGGIGLLGVASVRYANTDPTNPLTKRMMFFRNCSAVLNGKNSDAPTAALLGQTVYLADNNTVKVTKTTGDQPVTLLEVLANNQFRVWIP
jgi:hypothetical protein